MKEIKFRAWDKIFNKWIHPSQVQLSGTGIVTIQDENLDYLIDNDHKQAEIVFYTGLKDKNGTEIYEGDKVKLGVLPTEEEPEEEIHTAEVMFSKGQFWITHYGFPLKSYACNDKCFIEVIGNIYENPELLKEANK